jgi:hypothetical protein
VWEGVNQLADGMVRSLNATTGAENGFISQIPAYMPSTLPGFAGMIEGYPDIPPAFTGDLDNSVGSSSLQAL